ncbi:MULTISPECIES: threonine--tRNA ligase [unclassified Paludibacterium]|uniref:threonine--tRNA ligase n=1 Tax=unclassified Paludibacterium TaxID=2618429 RepID=UPI001C051BAD|nr:threonine--tRNA ligase [Paludibacterium sp. B53371]BEV72904.1 hypothetical protein THUN1379_23860 [Paludibacterium sp. THUN1379]
MVVPAPAVSPVAAVEASELDARDHRLLGQQLDLFHLQPQAPGAVFWHPRGWTLFNLLIDHLRRHQQAAGYVEVNTPDLMDLALWQQSGHWDNFRQHMFTSLTQDERQMALKPMSCPGAVQLFAHGLKSWRDLPLRMAEFGKVHRYEPSGALMGLKRLRHFTQDDAHIFCTLAQMDGECQAMIQLLLAVYRDFGFDQVRIRLSTRPAQRMGSDALWDRLEAALSGTLQALGVAYEMNPGEGAFYGPKLEFVLTDAIGRDWQCGTLQVDLILPERFDLGYIDAQGERVRPVMLHRAVFGSLERFMAVLLEHHDGTLPGWLAPLQAVLLPISARHAGHAAGVLALLQQQGLRVALDARAQTIALRVREHSLQRIPLMLVIGDQEVADGTLAVRSCRGERLGAHAPAAIVEWLRAH